VAGEVVWSGLKAPGDKISEPMAWLEQPPGSQSAGRGWNSLRPETIGIHACRLRAPGVAT
jgi:hypothetical protein